MKTTPDHKGPRRLLALGLLAGAMTLLAAPNADAQQNQPETLRPPTPKKADKVPILSYVIALVVIIAPLGVNFISSKRGHQD